MKAHDMLQYLVSAGYTQKQIEEATGIHQPSISRILTRKQADLSFTNGKRLAAIIKLHEERCTLEREESLGEQK